MLYCYFGWGGGAHMLSGYSALRCRLSFPKSSCVGILKIYVDDLMGSSHHNPACADQAATQAKLRAFFSPSAVAPKSILPTTTVEILGWRINFVRQSIWPIDTAALLLYQCVCHYVTEINDSTRPPVYCIACWLLSLALTGGGIDQEGRPRKFRQGASGKGQVLK